MELLLKNVADPIDKRKDNSDKKELFSKKHHPQTANYFKDQWAFIEDKMVRENIAYQMQYLEFMVHLYNDYQIYLTIESLLCKDIIVTVGGIIEAALFDLIASARKKAGMGEAERTDFTVLLGQAYNEYGLIDKDMWHFCHELRKVRNLVHLKAADFREHVAYTPEQANDCIKKLEEFRLKLEK
ncbi:hypothetical protein KGQ34_00705 [Patescibacteria group bacterium]|nr:hypothetical protein [Patescibacteria group bacterium]